MSAAPLEALLDELAVREREIEEGGGAARQARQRRLGRLNVRERMARLLDDGSFVELGRHVRSRHASSSARIAHNLHQGDGLVCGLGRVSGRAIAVYGHDPTVLRGALGNAAARKLTRLLDLAGQRRLPVVALVDCEGVRVEEGTDAIASFGEVIGRTIALKGRAPQLTLACGLCVGGAAYTAVLTDLVAMVKGQSYMFVTGAKVTRVVTGERSDLDALGGWELHARETGSCHAALESEDDGIAWLKQVLAFLDPVRPSADLPDRPVPELEHLIPTAQRRVYDIRKVLGTVFDAGSLLETGALFAPNLVTTFARLGGRAVGVVASQPLHLAGCLDVRASQKGAHFVDLVSRLGLPLVTLVDVPGYYPGADQERLGALSHGSRLLAAYGGSTSPKVCVVLRKSFGGASVLSFAADIRLALPTARVDPMGPDGTLEVVLGPEPGDASDADREARAQARADWLALHDNAWFPAESGYFDRVVAPREVRRALHGALEALAGGAP